MIMIRSCSTAAVLVLLCLTGWAQQIHQFKNGLVAGPCHRYGREALVTDHLAYALSQGTLKSPVEGQALFVNEGGNTIAWKTIDADTAGRFRGEGLFNGYLYLTYNATIEGSALLNVSGNAMCFVNGAPRGGDIYGDGWVNIPVRLKKGLNEFYVRCPPSARWQGVKAKLVFPGKSILLSTDDSTLPHIVLGEASEALWGAVVAINSTESALAGITITATLEGNSVTTTLPALPAMTTRKVGFRFNGAAVNAKKSYTCTLQLKQKGKVLDEKTVTIDAVNAADHHSYTFISNIDGSVQYYSVAPQAGAPSKAGAFFLSVHGAGVQAIGQARAYKPKDWGVLVAPTNRRPRGFNWEDWGRLDALEVFELGTKRYNPDPQKIYLTGHSMGGHGTWFLGATYPDKWAAIAPCAGYPTLTGYGSADGKIPDSGRTPAEKLLLRASNGSNIISLSKNYGALGVYIHHGDSDKVVSVDYARQMKQELAAFHKDFSYYEYPGGSHWFGSESVDWPPLFEYFKWHSLAKDSAVNVVDFTTANPAVSSTYRWAAVLQQQQALVYSRLQLARNKVHKTITGTTENVTAMSLSLAGFTPGDVVTINLDQQPSFTVTAKASGDNKVYLVRGSQWQVATKPDVKHKGIVRNGTFKEPFNHRMVFVYGTAGNTGENTWAYNKARYDAEVWYYRGNGAVDMIADKDFDTKTYADRGVILYGNATTNSAWKKLLSDCPVQVQRGSINVGDKQYQGDDLGAYFMWPRADSDIASVAVVSGTGLPGMRAAEANQYFAAGSGFPDYMIFSTALLKDGAKGIRLAGYYNNEWRVDTGDASE